MKPLTQQQKDKLRQAILEKKVTDLTTLQVFQLVSELEEKVESLTKDLKEELNKSVSEVKASEVSLDKVLESVKGKDAVVDYPKLIQEVVALIPPPKDGISPTVDYKKIIDEVVSKIPVPKDGVSPVIDYAYIISQIPVPKDGENGENGKDGSPDTPKQIADKLNTQEEVVDQKVIKGLVKKISDISLNIAHGAVKDGAKLYTGISETRALELIRDNTPAGNGSGDMVASTYDPAGVSEQLVGLTATQTLTNKRITKRVVTAADATSITPTGDTADWTEQANTQATGTLTINAPTGSPTSHQAWGLNIKSTNVQTFSWNAIFVGGTNPLPTATTGGGKWDYYTFIYNSTSLKWYYTGSAINFT